MEQPVMFLRNSRWLVASLATIAAICLAPARSNAEITILVEELNASGTVVATSGPQTLSGLGGTVNFNGIYFSGMATISTNSNTPANGLPGFTASLTPSFNGVLGQAFDVTQDHKLRITATDTGFQPNGPLGQLKVQVAGSTGLHGGTESIVEDTSIYNPATNASILLVPNLTTPDGTLQQSIVDASGLTNPYAIQQTLTISFSDSPSANATFASTGGASLTTAAPVPAPAGLALALIGLPLIGLRRALRKRAAV